MASPVQLPDNVIYYNILPRLPFRSLTRLTAVCKAWRHIIRRDDAFATLQAQAPSPASVAIARCLRGSLRILTPDSADVVPPDRYLMFVPADHGKLFFCACTGGVICFMERRYEPRGPRWLVRDLSQWRSVRAFFVVNLATRKFRRVPFDGDVVTAGLAYDPETTPREGFRLVVLAVEDGARCRFWRFTSQRDGWSASREAFTLPPDEEFKPKPVYARGRVHWLSGDAIVWYDFADDRAGTMPLLAAGSWWECDGNRDLSAWRGRLRLARVNTLGMWVWELADGAGGAGPARWEMVHSRLWEEVPGLICPRTSWTRVRWSLGTVEMEAGGEEAVCVVVTMEREGDDPTKTGSPWRGLLRYDVRTGAALAVLELGEDEEIGPLVDYHSSMAKLPVIMGGRNKHPGPGRARSFSI